MASFRKSSPKSRGALEASTALPAATADLVAHGGEQAARLTEDALTVSALPSLAAPKRGARKTEAIAIEAAAPAPMPGDLPATTFPVVDPAGAIEEAATPIVEQVQANLSAAETLGEATQETIATVIHETDDHSDGPTPAEAPDRATGTAATIVGETMHGAGEAEVTLVERSVMLAEHSLSDAERMVELTGAEASKAIAATSADARHAVRALDEINASVAEAVRTTIEQTMSHWTAMMKVRSVPEAITLNTEHLHRRMQAFASQSRQFTVLAQRLAADAIAALRPGQTF